MNYEDFVRATEILSQPVPCGYVVSQQDYYYIQNHFSDLKPTLRDYTAISSPFAARLFPVQDVPEKEVLVFYKESVLAEYLELAEKIGHKAAVQRLQAYVDSELIRESTLRALLEVS